MSVTIDSLDIQIKSSAGSAAQNIQALANALGQLKANGNVSKVSNSLSRLSSSLDSLKQQTGVQSTIDGIVRAMNSLSRVNAPAGFTNAVSALRRATNVISAIPAGNFDGVARIATAMGALNNVAAPTGLASALSQLNKIPKITQKLDNATITQFADKMRDLSNALAPLATQLNNVASSFSQLPSWIRQATNAANRFQQTTQQTSGSSLGLSANLSSLINPLRELARRMSSTLEQAKEWDGISFRFGRAFGEQADDVYKHVQRINKVMGINTQSFMQYSSMFGSMLKGFGMSQEKTTQISVGLTELSYDIWAAYNDRYKSLNDAYEAVRSAITGEIEPIRNAGIALTEASLQQYLDDIGMAEIKVANLAEAQKAEVRYAAMVNAAMSQGIVGTYAKEMNTAEGVMRNMSQQLRGLAQAFGSLLLPAISAVIPYITAFVSVLYDAIAAVASFFGISFFSIDWGNGLGSITEGASDAEQALGGAGGAAKKLKDYMMGFDELNVISPDSGGGGGGGGSGMDWEGLKLDSLWDEAVFAAVNKSVDALKYKFKDLIDGIKVAAEHLWNFREILIAGTVITAVSMAVRKLKKAWATVKTFGIGVAATTFLNAFKAACTGITTFFPAIVAGLDAVRASLGVVAKTFITIVAAVAEFAVIKNVVRELTLGTKEWWVALTELGVVAVAAGAALYTAFGPAGLVVAAVVGLGAAIVGVISAMNEMRDAAIMDTFLGSGTYAISKLAEDYTAFTQAITDGMDELISFGEEIAKTQQSAEDASTGVLRIADAFELGAYSAEDAVPKIVASLQTLASDTQKLMSQTYDAIVMALVGSFGDAYEQMGSNVEQAVETISTGYVAVKGEMGDLELQMANLATQYESGAISSAEYTARLVELSGRYNELIGLDLVGFTTELEALKDGLDWTALESNGNLDPAKVQAFFSGIAETAVASKADINAYYDEFQANLERAKAWSDDPTYQAKIAEMLSVSEQARADALASVESAVADIADTLQTDLISRFGDVVTASETAYAGQGPIAKFLQSESNYIQGGLEAYQRDVIDPVNAAIEAGLAAVGTSGEVSATDAMNTILDALFDFEGSSVSRNAEAATFLQGEISTMLTDLGITVDPKAREIGGNVVTGLGNGMTEQVAALEAATTGMVQTVPDTAMAVLDEHSPSKVFHEIGMNVGLGFEQGLTEGWPDMANWFDTNVTPMFTSGYWEGTFQAIPSALGTKLQEAQNAAAEKWNSIRGWFNSNVSPKFELGYWHNKLDSIPQAVREKLDATKTTIQEKWAEIDSWYESTVAPRTELSYWTDTFGVYQEVGREIVANLKTGLSDSWDDLAAWWDALVLPAVDIKIPTFTYSGVFNPQTGQAPTVNVAWQIKKYANGGFPGMGQMFIAREAGPELVGSINGRTAVANNDQIVAAVSQGVYEAVRSAMASQNDSEGSFNVNVFLDSKQITAAVEKRQRERGVAMMTGGAAFA